jgi:hypothetical protein
MRGSTTGIVTIEPAAVTGGHTLTLPGIQGSSGTVLTNNGSGALSWATAGNVVGPSSATDNAVARYDSTTGKLVQNSLVTISDSAAIAGAVSISMNGTANGTLTLQPAELTFNHTLIFPDSQGSASTYLKNDGSGVLSWSATGDVIGPSSSTDNAIARYNLATGKSIQSSTVTISDTSDVAGVKTLAMSGSSSGVITLQAASSTANHTLTLPATQATTTSFLKNNGSGALSYTPFYVAGKFSFGDVGSGTGTIVSTGDFTNVSAFLIDVSTSQYAVSWTGRNATPKSCTCQLYTDTGSYDSVNNDIAVPLVTQFLDGLLTVHLEQTTATVQNAGLMITIFY